MKHLSLKRLLLFVAAVPAIIFIFGGIAVVCLGLFCMIKEGQIWNIIGFFSVIGVCLSMIALTKLLWGKEK